MQTTLTPERERAYIRAIEAGHTTVRELAEIVGVTSTSTVARHLRKLEKRGKVVLRRSRYGSAAAAGRDWCAAWDACARLAGNPEA